MCQICLDLDNGRLTVEEAKRAAREMVLTVDDEYGEEMEHYLDIFAKLEEEDEKKNF
jgi:hypothetical protein